MRTNTIGRCKRDAHPQLLARLSPGARRETGLIRAAIAQLCGLNSRRHVE